MMQRRKFLKQASITVGALGTFPSQVLSNAKQHNPWVGIQISPHAMLDEGIESCLDILQGRAGVNTLVCYSHTYHASYQRPIHVMADHGFGTKDLANRKLPRRWVKSDPSLYKNTSIGHQQVTQDYEYGNRDLFKELEKPLRKRGMKLQARMLEAGANRQEHIPNYDKVLTTDLNGQPGRGPCWNHPDYREWLYATAEDLIRQYPHLDGIQYGAERTGPLSYLLDRGLIPTCFCEHCLARNIAHGIEEEPAKQGYRELYDLIKRLEAGQEPPIDGILTMVYRIYQKYPEVLSWNYQWFQADNEIHQGIYDRIKSINPSAQVGRHVDHQRSSWDIYYRSAVSYADMTASADFIKPILYHDIFGLRLHYWVLERMSQRINKELSMEQALELFYARFGHDPKKMPNLEQLDELGLGPEYVFNETKRCVRGVAGKAKVYAGIGIDVPWHLPDGGMRANPSPPERTYEAVQKAFEAGADGILISREYNEMRLESLSAVGKALDDLNK
jgi:hypothetical protein